MKYVFQLIYLLFLTNPIVQAAPFVVKVVDPESGRGVPLVVLETIHHQTFVTDNAGVVAIDSPELMEQEVYLRIRSHGYEFPEDRFGFRGRRFVITPGGNEEIKLKRINLAERLYRITGGGTFSESVKAGHAIPENRWKLKARTMGSDSAHTAVFRDRIFWIWGDTKRVGYPLGNFHTTAATSSLKGDPASYIDLDYIKDENGFTKQVANFPGKGPTWLDALVTVIDEGGRERLVASYVKIEPPLTVYERGLCEFDSEKEQFVPILKVPLKDKAFPEGHPFRHEGRLYFGNGTPDLVMDDSFEAWSDPARWESIKPTEKLSDVDSGKTVKVHRGAVSWNEYRKKWAFIFTEIGGEASALGEIWYGESESPTGPWSKAIKVVTHNQYSFYNPFQHPVYSNASKGRYLYFEGTYTKEFSGNPVPTPRYDYNQIMYRIDLADTRFESLAR